ncbi:MAG: MarR family transcriptional regulator, partial [Fusobacterium sp.]|uniref:MarR family transcriptional regulator n=1 Tax=Fusobacterium sp. TaxID=68766 RepID=UPI003FA0F4E0
DIFNQALKTNKELFSQNIGLRDDHTYALKVIDYTKNMNIAINNVIESNKSLDRNKAELYSYFKKEIAKHRADGYISLAEVEEKQGSNQYLRSAQNLYYKANQIYSKYQSNYRNSYSKYESVKYKADLNDARDNYNKGMEEYRNAGSSKAKYRAANYYFREAQKYISNYKDTNKLLSETKEKGYFKYSLSSNNGDVKNKISNALNPIAYPVTSGVELFIDYRRGEYSYNTFSYTNTEQIRKEIQTSIDSNGKAIIKAYNFTKTTTTVEELGTIPYTFSIRGAYYNNNISNEVTVKNTVNNVKYSGEVPPGSEYRNSDNKLLGSNELKKKVEEKLKKEVNEYINSMVNDLKRI